MNNITRCVDKKDESNQLIGNGLPAEDAFNLNHCDNRILMNKSNYISTVYTSLKIVVQEQNNINKINEVFIADKNYLDMGLSLYISIKKIVRQTVLFFYPISIWVLLIRFVIIS
jgi:hypothetical protein